MPAPRPRHARATPAATGEKQQGARAEAGDCVSTQQGRNNSARERKRGAASPLKRNQQGRNNSVQARKRGAGSTKVKAKKNHSAQSVLKTFTFPPFCKENPLCNPFSALQ
eukprot:gene14580-biopygen11162